MVSATQNRKFHLIPFSLYHHQATMKVGMDSILLGIWTDATRTERVLDIGSGSGILSLLLATKTKAKIDAIDLDPDSVAEAKTNFSVSPFYYRIKAIAKNFITFSEETLTKYDLIISNPPFFVNGSKPDLPKKKQARHGDSLSYGQLLEGVVRILQPDGRFSLVLPYNESSIFLNLANSKGFILQKQLLIFPVRGLQPNRINMELGTNHSKNLITQKLVIREEDRSFTEEYERFVQEWVIGKK